MQEETLEDSLQLFIVAGVQQRLMNVMIRQEILQTIQREYTTKEYRKTRRLKNKNSIGIARNK